MVYSRRESIMTTTKRHPARIHAKVGATRDGRLTDLPDSCQRELHRVIELTAGNTSTTLILALSYSGRLEIIDAVRSLGLECARPRATFYIWAEVPKGYTSVSFTERVIKETGVVVTPGSGFGKGGEGFVRFSLTVANDRLQEAVERIKALRF